MNLLHVTSYCISFSHSQIGQTACVPKPNSYTGHVPFKKGTCRLVGETREVCHLAHWFVPVIKLYSGILQDDLTFSTKLMENNFNIFYPSLRYLKGTTWNSRLF